MAWEAAMVRRREPDRTNALAGRLTDAHEELAPHAVPGGSGNQLHRWASPSGFAVKWHKGALLRPARRPLSLGAFLADARRRRGLSQRALATRIARDHTVVVRWEGGSREPTLL